MSVNVVTPPFREPLTLAEAKQHLRVDIDDDDELIRDQIATARALVESQTHRQLLTATLRMTLDRFPSSCSHRPCGEGDHPLEVRLERPPLRSVESVTYLAGDGTLTTLDPTSYYVDTDSTPGRIVPAIGRCWPGVRSQPNAVAISYTAGFDYLDPKIKIARSAIRLLLANWYENREAVGSRALGVEVPFAVQSLLDSLSWGDYR